MKNYVDTSVTLLQTQISANAVSANAVINTANTSMKNYVDSSFVKLTNSSTQTIASDITVTGNLTINGTTTTVNTTTVETRDSLLKLAKDNTTADSIDIGFYAPYRTGGLTRYTGLIRKAAGRYYLAQALTSDPTSNTISEFGTNYRATLDANFSGGMVSGLANTIGIIDGGTGASSASQALTNLLPTGTSAGYVLTTGGPGTFYWAAGGGGGGSTPGTTINSARLSYTATAGQTVFTTPTYVPGASQLRVYLNGVRQYSSDYTETDSTTVTLNVGCFGGESILVEVDGYIVNPYFANTITFTAPFGDIISSANTIQLAIQDLESRKAALISPTFTGSPLAPTAESGTSNTMIATTEFVQTVVQTVVQSVSDIKSNIASPTFTGSPLAPTAATGTSNTMIATTAFVQTANTNMKTYVDDRFAANVVTSNSTFGSIGVGTSATGVSGEIVATNNITAYYSDERLKTNLGPIVDALDKVKSLNGFYHEANEIAQALGYVPVREVGVSAQEVQAVLPEIVAPAPIDNQYLTVRYEKLTPLLIEAIKELSAKVDELQKRLDNK